MELEYPFPYTTAKIGFMWSKQEKSRSIFRRHFNNPEERNLAVPKRLWLTKFDKIIRQVEGNAQFLIELDEEWNFWYVSYLY